MVTNLKEYKYNLYSTDTACPKIDDALAGYIECLETQFGGCHDSLMNYVQDSSKINNRQAFQEENISEIFDTNKVCLASGRESKCAAGKDNSNCYLSCTAFHVKVKKGKVSSKVLKHLGIDPAKTTSPEESASEHGILLSLLNLSPALFKSPIRLIDVWHAELCIYTDHSDFYKGEINIKRKEEYDKYIGSVVMLPRYLRRKKWSCYHDMKEYFSSCNLHNCDKCWEAKKCGKEGKKNECMIKTKHCGYSCWVTPEMCTRNRDGGYQWLYKYNCWKCEYYKKPQRMLSFKRVLF